MKKILPLLISLVIPLAFSAMQLSAQDEKPMKVTITITEDEKVTTDTTFEIKEGQDPDMIHEIVSQVTGEDFPHEHSGSGTHKKMIMVHSDEDVEVHSEKGHYEYRFGDDIYIMKNEDGNVTVMEAGEGKRKILIHEDSDHGKHKKIEVHVHSGEDIDMDMDECEEVDVYIIKDGDKDVKVVKTVRVEIETEEEDCDPDEEKKENKQKK